METFITALVYLGYAVLAVGLLGVWGSSLVFFWRACRESLLWGLACALVPIAGFIFALRYWPQVRGVVKVHLLSLLIVAMGVGLIFTDPAKKALIADAIEDREALISGITTGAGDTAERRQTRRSAKEAEQALALSREQHQRATGLYALIEIWRKELVAKRPGEGATPAEISAFQAEYANYQGLLAEYRTLTAEIKKAEATPAPSPAPSPTPSEK